MAVRVWHLWVKKGQGLFWVAREAGSGPAQSYTHLLMHKSPPPRLVSPGFLYKKSFSPQLRVDNHTYALSASETHSLHIKWNSECWVR